MQIQTHIHTHTPFGKASVYLQNQQLHIMSTLIQNPCSAACDAAGVDTANLTGQLLENAIQNKQFCYGACALAAANECKFPSFTNIPGISVPNGGMNSDVTTILSCTNFCNTTQMTGSCTAQTCAIACNEYLLCKNNCPEGDCMCDDAWGQSQYNSTP